MFLDFQPIVSDDSGSVLSDQQYLPDVFAGGFNAGSSDPSGMNGADSDSVNPNPTGGWQTTALAIARLGLEAFKTYEAGSTAASTPPRRVPGTVITAPGTSIGGISTGNISTILFVLAGGIILFVLVKSAEKR